MNFSGNLSSLEAKEPADESVGEDKSSGSSEPSVIPVETSTDASSASSEVLSSASSEVFPSVSSDISSSAVNALPEINSVEKISLVPEDIDVADVIITETSVVTEEIERAEHVDQQVHSSVAIISTVLTSVSEVMVEEGQDKMTHSEEKLDDTAEALIPAAVSSEPEEVEKVNNSTTEIAQKCHVRIDNFQRPLTDKLLFEWLATTLGYELSKEQLWMNKIKTHCYIDFDSLQSAEACIAAVTGQKVNSKHTQHLVAAITTISAAEADTSVEGNMKPQEWKNCQSNTQKLHTLLPSAGSTNKVQLTGYQTKIDHGLGVESYTTFSVSNDTLQSSSNFMNINNNKAGYVPQMDSSESIRGNTQIGFSTKRNSSAAGLTEESLKRQNTGITSTSSLRETREKEKEKEKEKEREREQLAALSNQNNNFGDTVELDTLFRKTLSLPPLYWLPVSTDIVSKRKLLQVQS